MAFFAALVEQEGETLMVVDTFSPKERTRLIYPRTQGQSLFFFAYFIFRLA